MLKKFYVDENKMVETRWMLADLLECRIGYRLVQSNVLDAGGSRMFRQPRFYQ